MAIQNIDLSYQLHEYEKFELAFLLKNRHEQLSEIAKQNLVYEIKQRDLSPAALTDLIEEKLAHSGTYNVGECKRCSSRKLLYPETINKKGRRLYYVCEVCGENNFSDAVERNQKKVVFIIAIMLSLLVLIGALMVLLMTF